MIAKKVNAEPAPDPAAIDAMIKEKETRKQQRHSQNEAAVAVWNAEKSRYRVLSAEKGRRHTVDTTLLDRLETSAFSQYVAIPRH